MAIKLTDSLVKSASAEATRYAFADATVTGLTLEVTTAGTKTWYYRAKVRGKVERVRLGRYPAVMLSDARKAVRELAGRSVKGEQLPTRTRQNATRRTLDDLFDFYIESHAMLRKRTWKRDVDEFSRWFDDWRHRQASSITKHEVQRRIAGIAQDSGLAPANKARALLSVIFNRAIKADLIDKNPVVGTERYEIQPRQRYLKQSEVQAFLEAVMQLERRTTRDYLLMLLALGQRRTATAAMRWQDIDLDRRVWTIPAEHSKLKRPQIVGLTSFALDILKLRLLDRDADCEWVFPGNEGSKSGHLNEPKAALQRVRELSGVHDVTIHDLRRTLGMWATAGGASLRHVQIALGHSDVRTTARHYQALEISSVRETMDAAVESILEAAGDARPKLGVIG